MKFPFDATENSQNWGELGQINLRRILVNVGFVMYQASYLNARFI